MCPAAQRRQHHACRVVHAGGQRVAAHCCQLGRRRHRRRDDRGDGRVLCGVEAVAHHRRGRRSRVAEDEPSRPLLVSQVIVVLEAAARSIGRTGGGAARGPACGISARSGVCERLLSLRLPTCCCSRVARHRHRHNRRRQRGHSVGIQSAAARLARLAARSRALLLLAETGGDVLNTARRVCHAHT